MQQGLNTEKLTETVIPPIHRVKWFPRFCQRKSFFVSEIFLNTKAFHIQYQTRKLFFLNYTFSFPILTSWNSVLHYKYNYFGCSCLSNLKVCSAITVIIKELIYILGTEQSTRLLCIYYSRLYLHNFIFTNAEYFPSPLII